jgi:hypothetical protein
MSTSKQDKQEGLLVLFDSLFYQANKQALDRCLLVDKSVSQGTHMASIHSNS